jgi:hypothetical protein
MGDEKAVCGKTEWIKRDLYACWFAEILSNFRAFPCSIASLSASVQLIC